MFNPWLPPHRRFIFRFRSLGLLLFYVAIEFLLGGSPSSAQEVRFGGEVSLQSHHGRFLVAELDGRLEADRREPLQWERFRLVDPTALGNAGPVRYGDQVALLSTHGKYVAAELPPAGDARAERDSIGTREIWRLRDPFDPGSTEIIRPRDLIALNSFHGTYLVAESDHRARADRNQLGPWERWRIGLAWTDFYYDVPLPCPPGACCECPIRGRFDGANCFIARPPEPAEPFLWHGNFYYSSQHGTECPLGAFDGANCMVGSNSDLARPFLWDRGYYLKANCQPIKGWAELHTHMFAEFAWPPGFIWGTVDDLATPQPEPAEEALPCCDGRQSHASLKPALRILSEGLTQAGGHTAFLGLSGPSAGDTGLHLGKRYGFIGDDCPSCGLPGLCRDEVPWNVSAAAVIACNSKSRSECFESGYCGARGSSLKSLSDDLEPCWAQWPDCDRGDLCLQTTWASKQLTCSDLNERECRRQQGKDKCTWAVCRHRRGARPLTCSSLSKGECSTYRSYGCRWVGLGRWGTCMKGADFGKRFECNDLNASDCTNHGQCYSKWGCFKDIHQLARILDCNDLTTTECAGHKDDGCRVRDCVKLTCHWDSLVCEDLSPQTGRHFRDWPAWDTPTHQQHWWGHLLDAHKRGLEIVSVSILSVHPLATLMPGHQRTPYRTILDQLNAARLFDAAHDWVEIATTPAEARQIIREGRLAMVLTLEANFAFCKETPCGAGTDETSPAAILQTLDEYRARGLSGFQVVAHFDNLFSGLAIYQGSVHTLQWFHDEILRDGDITENEILGAMRDPTAATVDKIRELIHLAGGSPQPQVPTIKRLEDLTDLHALLGIIGGVSGPSCKKRTDGSAIHCGKCLKDETACQNIRGLSPLGQWLILRLMERGMLIDVAHMSERGIRDVAQIVKDRPEAPYPFYVSHGNPRQALHPDATTRGRHLEKPTSDKILELIMEVGGMFGQRTGADEMINTGINDCQGSTKAFAEALRYLVDFGDKHGSRIPVGFAVDLNGMTHQSVPRFVDPTDDRAERRSKRAACLGDADAQAAQGNPVADHGATPRTDESALNRRGLAHIGLMGGFVDDLRNVGLEPKYIEALESGAEEFLRMWERSQ